MLLNGVFATIIAILSIFVALILSNNASLHTTEDINATSAVVRGKVRRSARPQEPPPPLKHAPSLRLYSMPMTRTQCLDYGLQHN